MSGNTKPKGSKTKDDTGLSEERRRHYIEVAAYYIAEKSKSDCCCDLDNWLAAEAEIDQLLAEGKLW
ncbi:MAG: DUF2934 domain-containing protein [Gallionellaceae bacterium]